jgi:hypothetical protein
MDILNGSLSVFHSPQENISNPDLYYRGLFIKVLDLNVLISNNWKDNGKFIDVFHIKKRRKVFRLPSVIFIVIVWRSFTIINNIIV